MLEELSDKRLDAEFDRLSSLKEECAVGMYEIRQEKARRKQVEIDNLQSQIDALNQ